jgi:hypothetical protein
MINMPVVQAMAMALFVSIVGPFVTLWSLNTLFPSLHIPYDFWSWLAMVWINGMVIGRRNILRA